MSTLAPALNANSAAPPRVDGSALTRDVAAFALRVAFAAAFLSAVADRFGLWGRPGAPGVAWGDFASFAAYSARLTFYLPAALHGPAAWIATVAEVVLGIALLVGLFPRTSAFLSGLLLLAFGLSMALATRVKAPLDYSVFTAAAAAILLATLPPDRFTLTHLLGRNGRACADTGGSS